MAGSKALGMMLRTVFTSFGVNDPRLLALVKRMCEGEMTNISHALHEVDGGRYRFDLQFMLDGHVARVAVLFPPQLAPEFRDEMLKAAPADSVPQKTS